VRVLTLYVSTSGSYDNDCLSEATACPTLHAAIRLSTPGSTIHIGPGEFSTDATGPSVYHDLTFLGAGIDATVISSPGDVLTLSRGRYAFRDLTISGTSGEHLRNGLDLRDGSVVTLENVRIRRKGTAIRLGAGTQLVSPGGLMIEGNLRGIGVADGSDLRLTAPVFTGNGSALSVHGAAEVVDAVFDANGEVGAGTGAATATIFAGDMARLTLRGGRISNSRGYGIINTGSTLLDGVLVNNNAGIAVWHQQGDLEVRATVVRDNSVYGIAVGGRSGVPSIGTVDVHETAVVRNRSAGIRIDGGRVHLQNVTVSGNVETSSGGGGIWMTAGEMFLLDSTVAFNSGRGIEATRSTDGPPTIITARRSVVGLNSGVECFLSGPVSASYGTSRHMCVEAGADSLRLGPLAEEAGTLVHPLLPGSPLIDAAGASPSCAAVDQRGFARPSGITCDDGAYEAGATSAMAVVIATPQATPTPGIVPLPSATPTAGPPVFTFVQNANCRRGPGTLYSVVTSLVQGAAAQALARNDLSSWYRVAVPGTQVTCWVAGSTGEASGGFEGLPVEAGLPLPGSPGSLSIGQAVCTPNLNVYSVPLAWGDAGNETGYRLYRNGSLVATLAANTVGYDDQAPKGVALSYALEAFNAVGTSSRVETGAPACP
jgi:hypothetical protein